MTTMDVLTVWPVQPRTTTRKQRLHNLLALPVPTCASTEWKYEYYKILWMLRELINSEPLSAQQRWKQELLMEALRTLHAIEDPTDSPAVASKADHARWTDIMMRRIVAEALWEDDAEAVSFYDCCEALKVGRSRAAAARLSKAAESSWTTITDSSLSTEFGLSVKA